MILWLLLANIINIVVHWLWFFTLHPISHGDAIYIPEISYKEFFNFSVWQSYLNVGGYDFGPSFYPFNFIASVLANNGAPSALIQRIIFFFPIVLFGSSFSFLLCYKLTKNGIASFIGSLIFNFNSYYIIATSGHITLATAYTLYPLVLLLYIHFIENKNKILIPIISLVLFATSFWEFRAFYVLIYILGLMYLFSLPSIIQKKSIWVWLKYSFAFFLPVLIAVLFNLYWIYPIATDAQGEVLSLVAGRSLFFGGIENANLLLTAFTVFQTMWSGGKIIPFSVHPIPLTFFILPIVSFSSFLFYKKNKYIIFFISVALFGLLLSKFYFPPFIQLYPWLFDHFPGFGAFREPSKFTVLIYISYAVLTSFMVTFALDLFRKTTRQKIATYTFIVGLVVLMLWNAKPLFTGEVRTLFVPREIPQDYKIYNAFIEKQPEYFRTFWIPVDSRWAIYTNNKPKINAINYIESVWMPTTNDTEAKIISILSNKALGILHNTFSDHLFDLISVKYVIIPIQDEKNEDNFFKDYVPRENIIKEVTSLPYLKKIDIGTKELLVFENMNYRPHIYATPDLESILKPINYVDVKHEYIRPTHYTISLQHIKKPFYLSFSEKYHPNWKLFVEKNNTSLPDENHIQTDISLNAFYIDPSYIKENYPDLYIQNKDGSINVNLNLKLISQSRVYVGTMLGISLSVILLLFYFNIEKIEAIIKKYIR